MDDLYEAPCAVLVADFRRDTALTSRGGWPDLLGWWF
ncbi:MAG: hypothetical protein K0R81_142 [Microbacterium sp.]|jgi:hypothetical protein|nr:hypothetical protein [Microbacterium sp.]